jgi:hypothetical protein
MMDANLGNAKSEQVTWMLVTRSIMLLLAAMAAFAWIAVHSAILYSRSGAGNWISMSELEGAGSGGMTTFVAVMLLVAAGTHAVKAAWQGSGRSRAMGVMVVILSVASLAAFVGMLRQSLMLSGLSD